MALDITDKEKDIYNIVAANIQAELSDSSPFLRNAYLKALALGYTGAISEFIRTLQIVLNQIFYDTAEDEYLERWASIYGITRNPATKAKGLITVGGVASTLVPVGTVFSSSQGGEYETLSDATISSNTISVSSITRSGSVATVTTASSHNLASNFQVTIAGANETDYNGTFTIVVTGEDTFTYEVSGTPSTPATGTITSTSTTASINVQSLDFGSDQNLEDGSKVTLSSPIAGVDNAAYVQFTEIAGGSDEEGDEALRDRFLLRVQNPVTNFNNTAIELKAKEVTGVTRVFIRNVDSLLDTLSVSSITRNGDVATVTTSSNHGLQDGQLVEILGANEGDYNVEAKIIILSDTEFAYKVSGTPSTPATGTITANVGITSPGQVRVFFVRDNDGSGTAIIPTGSEITDVKNKLLEIKDVVLAESDLFVEAPTAKLQAFAFSSISPDTASMRTAIDDNLNAFITDNAQVGVDVTQSSYESIIANTVDATGARLSSFTLSSPSGDLTVASNELIIYNGVSF